MAIPKTEQEIFDKIQNMQPDDAFTLADAVLGILQAQKLVAKAILEIGINGAPNTATVVELNRFLGREVS